LVERVNQTLCNSLAAFSTGNQWAAELRKSVIAYNSAVHRTTKHEPAVVLYSQICKSIAEVPEDYRDLLQLRLNEYDKWESMSLLVHKDARENIVHAAEKMKADSLCRRLPTNISVNSVCFLLAPGDPSKKRNFLKPRHKDAGGMKTLLFPSSREITSFLDRGHYGVEVKVEELLLKSATVTYLTSGWKGETVGTREKVDLTRLKLKVNPIYGFTKPSVFLTKFLQNGLPELSDSLRDNFQIAWYSVLDFLRL